MAHLFTERDLRLRTNYPSQDAESRILGEVGGRTTYSPNLREWGVGARKETRSHGHKKREKTQKTTAIRTIVPRYFSFLLCLFVFLVANYLLSHRTMAIIHTADMPWMSSDCFSRKSPDRSPCRGPSTKIQNHHQATNA